MYQNVTYVHERRPFLDRSSKILQLPNVSYVHERRPFLDRSSKILQLPNVSYVHEQGAWPHML